MTSGGMTTVQIASGRLTAEVATQGAELVALRDEAGRDLLWNGDPAFWTGRAPILFPIVGRLKDDKFLSNGTTYAMRQHGIARLSRFELLDHAEGFCRLRLRRDETTRQAFPFPFDLEMTYRAAAATLTITGTVRNTGHHAMPVSFGYHPAFRWPLPYGAPADAHEITFAHDETKPLPTLAGGLLSGETKPSPVEGRHLALRPHLFDDDALIFLDPESRSVHFGPPNGRGLTVDFPGMPQLGIWSKPGAPFVCIEPWHGYASPADFDGDITEKPGMTLIPPGQSRDYAIAVTIDTP